MNRKEITKLLTETLINTRLNDRKYYATEVTLDYGMAHPKRVDVMEFKPKGVTHVSDIEKGEFICYEIKSCYEDVYSGNGLNFYGDRNYIVTTMETYKKLQEDMRSGKFQKHLREANPESSNNYGFMVLVPNTYEDYRKSEVLYKEWNTPTPISLDRDWKLHIIEQCNSGRRDRSIVELLFCMLRSGN